MNIHGNREGISKDAVNLLDYFQTGKPTDSYTQNIQDQVVRIREDDDWRENYMTLEMKMDQKYEEGLKVGRTEGERIGKIEGEKIGRTEGEKLGKTQGLRNRDKELIAKWINKGKTIAEIAEDLDKTQEYVKSLM